MAGQAPNGYAWARRDNPASPWHLARAVPFNHTALCGVDVGELFARLPRGETTRECQKCLARHDRLTRQPRSARDVFVKGA